MNAVRDRALILAAAVVTAWLAACSQSPPASTEIANTAAPVETVELPEVVVIASRTGSAVNRASPDEPSGRLE